MTKFTNNPFEKALNNFKAEKLEVVKEPKKEEPKAEAGSVLVKPKQKEMVSEEKSESVWRHPDTGLIREDQDLFESLCKIIKLSKLDRRYLPIAHCFSISHTADVSEDIKHWLGPELHLGNSPESYLGEDARKTFLEKADRIRKIEEITNILIQRGHEAEAVKWLLSRAPENIKYGGSKEVKLEEAKKSAKKAGKTIEEIAKAHGLENFLV